mmetsp:Transcript_47617/g.126270  ORF Transcript_47617/g.126270 Transcript_47617/m.126270 type:complete len:186 (-) Transcript_47617:479-1036(-)
MLAEPANIFIGDGRQWRRTRLLRLSPSILVAPSRGAARPGSSGQPTARDCNPQCIEVSKELSVNLPPCSFIAQASDTRRFLDLNCKTSCIRASHATCAAQLLLDRPCACGSSGQESAEPFGDPFAASWDGALLRPCNLGQDKPSNGASSERLACGNTQRRVDQVAVAGQMLGRRRGVQSQITIMQ